MIRGCARPGCAERRRRDARLRLRRPGTRGSTPWPTSATRWPTTSADPRRTPDGPAGLAAADRRLAPPLERRPRLAGGPGPAFDVPVSPRTLARCPSRDQFEPRPCRAEPDRAAAAPAAPARARSTHPRASDRCAGAWATSSSAGSSPRSVAIFAFGIVVALTGVDADEYRRPVARVDRGGADRPVGGAARRARGSRPAFKGNGLVRDFGLRFQPAGHRCRPGRGPRRRSSSSSRSSTCRSSRSPTSTSTSCGAGPRADRPGDGPGRHHPAGPDRRPRRPRSSRRSSTGGSTGRSRTASGSGRAIIGSRP